MASRTRYQEIFPNAHKWHVALQLCSVIIICTAALVENAIAQGQADTYPVKAATIVVPYSPGSSLDHDARLYSKALSEALGKPFVLDFKPGAGSIIGATFVAKAAPDGYTMMAITSTFTTTPALYKSLPYDPARDISAVSLISRRATMLVVHPSFQVNSLSEYLAYAKANPGKVNFGTSGAGGIMHMVGAWLHSETETKVALIHYKGSAPMFVDLFAGRVNAGPMTLFAGLAQVKAGKVRPIAALNSNRSLLMPDLKTAAEQGVPDVEWASWQGVLITGGTPTAVINKLQGVLAAFARSPDAVKRAALDGQEMVGSTPEMFRQTYLAEIERWKKVAQRSNITLDE